MSIGQVQAECDCPNPGSCSTYCAAEEIDRLRKALEHYADADNWSDMDPRRQPYLSPGRCVAYAYKDRFGRPGWEVARLALRR
jgi:hypothetical protein